MTAGRLLVVDATFNDHLSQQLLGRGRRSVSVRAHPWGEAEDDVLLPRLASTYGQEDWMLITCDDAMPAEHRILIDDLGLTIATLDGAVPRGMNQEHYKYEVVHRWAHQMTDQEAHSVRRYSLWKHAMWTPRRGKRFAR